MQSKKELMNYAALGAAVIAIVLATIAYLNRPTIAYINSIKVFSEFNLKKDLEKKLEATRTKNLKELDSIKVELQLKLNVLKVTNKKQGKEVIEYTNLEQQYYYKEKKYNEEYQAQSDQYTQQVWKQLNQYLKDYGKKNSYRYIFGAKGEGDIMYAAESDEITAEVIKYVNNRYENNE